ncbi:MAG: TetR/AcrR family transcriptional regulator [Rhodobacter sp.]|nr:TetR/AcrR family transcriptional regulator [Rhodobacter sp.]
MMKAKPKVARKRGRPRKEDVENREATSQLILHAALDQFSKHGFDATSTVNIAQKAGIAQSVLHYHFKTKELLWQETIHDLFGRINKEFPFRIDTSEDADFEAVLRFVIERHMKVASIYPEMARIIIIEGSLDTDRLRWLTEEYFRGTFKNFDKVLDGARKRGVIVDMPNHLLTHIIYSAGSVLFSIAPLINQTYGIDVTNPLQRDLTVKCVLEILMNGIYRGNQAPGA